MWAIVEAPLNWFINFCPFEWHLFNYNFCGVGTKVEDRLARGVKPINQLDNYCLTHDLHYKKHQDLKSRHIADKQLEERAFERGSDSGVGFLERGNALLISGAMMIKRKLGLGLKRKRRRAARKFTARNKTGGYLQRLKRSSIASYARRNAAAVKRIHKKRRNFLKRSVLAGRIY